MSLGPKIQHNVKSDWTLIERASVSRVVTNSNKNFWQPIASGLNPTMYRQKQIIPHFFTLVLLQKIWNPRLAGAQLLSSAEVFHLSALFHSSSSVSQEAQSLLWLTVWCRHVQARLEAASCAVTPWGDNYWQLSPLLRLGAYPGPELGTTCCYDSG